MNISELKQGLAQRLAARCGGCAGILARVKVVQRRLYGRCAVLASPSLYNEFLLSPAATNP